VFIKVPHLALRSTTFSRQSNQRLVIPIFPQPLTSPPPYPHDALLVNNLLSDVFSSSAVFPAETLLNIGLITPSPLAPVSLRHSSLYQVLRHESPTSPAQGTLQSRGSSIAHALEPQARQVPRPCTPALRDRQGSTIGPPEILLSSEKVASTSLTAVAVDPSPSLLHLPALDLSPPAQVQLPVSSATAPCVVVLGQELVCRNADGNSLKSLLTITVHSRASVR
jgi:hypothetical protein